MDLKDFFSRHPRVAVAFSGGADSAYLLHSAKLHAAEARAYCVRTAFQPQFERDDAAGLASRLGVEMSTIDLDILSDDEVAANSRNRCYFCKRRIFSAIIEQARADGFDAVLDGTNASDDPADRPGMQALKELPVLSPLRVCGLTKARIRELSRDAGLPTWDKPAYACLATRIPAGQRITAEALRRTELAEGFLASLGFSGFRVRTVGDSAKIQVRESQIPLLVERRARILERLKGEYESVCLDMEVRNED